MGRPRKEDKQKETAELMISVEDFARTRDSVVTGLTTLQTAVSDLLRSYIKHTNSVLGSTPHGLDTLGISNPLTSDLLAGALRNGSPSIAAAMVEEEPKKGKRAKKEKKEKKEKDPNEPKRPLTIYFLFATHARPIVKADLGTEASPGQVEEEINKRWKSLGDEDRAAWKEVYSRNRDQYLKDVEKYKASLKAASDAPVESPAADVDGDVDMAEDAATPGVGAEATESSGSDESDDEEEESEEEPAPLPKAPTPPVEKTPKAANKRRKTTKENGVAAVAAAPAHADSPIPIPSHIKATAPAIATPVKAKPEKKTKKEEVKEVAKESSPEEPKKKRGRKSKGAEEITSAAPVVSPEPAAEAPAIEKKNKRKRKSEGAQA